MKNKLLFIVLSIFSVNLINAQSVKEEKDKYDILLLSGTVKPVPNSGVLSEQRIVKEEIINGRYFRIIQFFQIPSQQEKEELKSKGIDLLVYLPNFSFFASVAEIATPAVLSALGNVRAVLPVLPEYKIHPALKNNKVPADAEVVRGKADLTITYFKGIPSVVIVKELQSKIKGVKILMHDDLSQIIKVRVKKKYVSRIPLISCVQYVEPVEKAQAENNSGTTGHRSNIINVGGLYYDGTGVGVSVGDGGAYFKHVDFTGRQKWGSASSSPHCTHVAGIIAGAGNIDPLYKGHASGAHMIYAYNFNDILSLSAITALYNGVDLIRVTNHSLGEGYVGYTSTARLSDLEVDSLPSLFSVHSSGNFGGFSSISGGYKSGKNAIATGNLDYKDIIVSSSSKGPSSDGRIKPDICAKGSYVQSTYPGNGYYQMSGTSMASPGAAGCFVQLIHAYRDMNAGNDPKLALLKGIVLNTAEDLGNIGPDYIHGWGRINAWAAYNTIKDQRYFSSAVAQGVNNTHTITIPANTSALKVMVYWADPAAAAGVSKALINDLDITLVSSSQTYTPWQLNYSSPSAAAIPGVDRDNNMEQVFVLSPAAGTYTLNVNGYLVPQGPQEYWVSYQFLTDDIKVTYPIGGESFVPGEVECIRWDTYGTTGTFTIEYSADSGATWNTLTSTVVGTDRYYLWTVPSILTGKALVRVSRGTKTNTSQAKFNIMNVPANLAIDWRCPASFQLSWTAVASATSYEAFLLGQKYMMPQGTTTGTSFWIQSLDTAITWASVRAFAANGQVIGRRAVAIQVPTATSGCLTSINNITGSSPYAVSVFPNPIGNHAIVSLIIAEDENISIKLMDVYGREIVSLIKEEKLSAGVHQFELQNTNASGIYMVMVKGNKGISYEKVIVTGI